MDFVKKLYDLKTDIVKNTDTVYNQEMSTFIQLLNINDISLINIHNKNDTIADYEFKKEVLSLIYALIENGLIIKNKKLLNVIADLIIKDIPEINIDFCIQLEIIIKKVWILCVKILFYCGHIEDLPQIKQFISSQDIPDLRNISLALIFKFDSFKSYDLENLSHFSSFSVLYDVVKLYKDELPEELKAKILINLYCILTMDTYNPLDKLTLSPNLYIKSAIKLTEKTINFAYLIFYEINFLQFPGLIAPPRDGTFSNEYLMLLFSLILDEFSALEVYKILKYDDVYGDMYNGINKLIIGKKTGVENVDPRDEKYLFFLLEVVVKLLHTSNNQMIKITFMMFIDPLMNYSLYQNENNNIVYDFLAYYCEDRETHNNILEFYKSKKVFKRENIFTGRFSSSLINFLWYINQELSLELALFSLRSEDPLVVKTCIDIFEKTDIDLSNNLLLNANHLRRTLLRSDELINILINYQISKKMIIDDILLINVLMSSENCNFFDYASLFTDFGKYMNDKFLEKIIYNIEAGLDFIENHITFLTVKFIKNNEKWFNLFLSNNKQYYSRIFKIYEKMLALDKNIEISFEDGFLLMEVAESSVFRILSQKIIQSATILDKKQKKIEKVIKNKYITNIEYKMNENVLKDYVVYLKTRLIVGDNIESLVKFLITDYLNVYPIIINEIVGFYKLMTGTNLDAKNDSILCTYDEKDTSSFIKNFYKVSDYEKKMLFLKLDDKIKVHDEDRILKIIKDVITNSYNDKLLYRQCLVSLLKLNKIDGLVRLIEDYEDKDLLLKINIRNIMTGGLYFNPKCVNVGNLDLQVSALCLLYFKKIWNVNSLRSWMCSLYKTCRDNEDYKYLIDDVSKKYDIEIY